MRHHRKPRERTGDRRGQRARRPVRREGRWPRELRRRGVAALLAAVLALGNLLSFAGLMPTAAHAAPDSIRMEGFSGDGDVGYFIFETTQGHAICANAQTKDPEVGDTFTGPTPITKMSASDLSGVDPYAYAYFCAFAPLGGSYNDYGFQGSDANRGAATFVANVLLQGGSVNERGQLAWADGTLISTNDIYTSRSDNHVLQGELPKIEALVSDARAHAGQSGWWDGSATYWRNSSSDQRQNLITLSPVTKTGGITLEKASAEPSVTEGNDLYDLSGAVYGVYSDEACTTEVGRMETDATGHASIDGLPEASYWVREISAPPTFLKDEAVHPVSVGAGVSATLRVSDVPVVSSTDLVVQKVDPEGAALGSWDAQGNATLEHAQFTVRFYEGHYADAASLPKSADRTWVIETREKDGLVRARLGGDWLVSGDAFYATTEDGLAVLPLGTLTVQETRAPAGYELTDGSVHLAQVVANEGAAGGAGVVKLGSWPETFDQRDAGAGLAVEDRVLTGGISVPKIDHELKEGVAQGDATLEGAVIGIYNASERAIEFEGSLVQPGGRVTGIETNAEGVASTAADALPYGTYVLKEEEPPEGYLLNETWNPTVSVQKGDVVVEAEQLEDPVVTGSGAVTKVDAETLTATPQGDAALADAEITIWNRSDAAVLVGGVLYQPDDVVARIHTSEKGGATSAELPYGTYEARETGASEGYLVNEDWAASFEIREDGEVVRLDDLPEPIVRGGVRVRKADAELGASEAQGDATLAGAEITVYNESRLPVIVSGETFGVGEAVMTLVTDEGGEASTEPNALPYGTYTVRETRAPAGYTLNEEWSETFQIRAQGQMVDLTGPERAVADDVIRGGVAVSKLDRELLADRYGIDLDEGSVTDLGDAEHDPDSDVEDAGRALGSATLGGAEIEITNRSAHAVRVEGQDYEPGAVVYTMVTDEKGECATTADLLPYGTYELAESAPSEGYLVNEGWSLTFSVREDGRLYDFREDEDDSLDEQAVRGDLHLQKKDEDSQASLAGVPFKVTSQTTGEWHLIVTDENGMADTSSEWTAHSKGTNASDAALLADGTIDESKLDASAGVWFTGRGDAETDPCDALGALPYDTYDVEELGCAANEGRRLVSTTVTVSRDGANLDLGTFDDKADDVAIETTLSWGDGRSRSVPATGELTLTDEVRFEGLRRGHEYRLESELHAFDATGTDLGVVASAETTFSPSLTSGSQDVSLTLDASGLAGTRLVAYERLYDGDELVASHEDPSDRDQTVWVPGVTTTLLSNVTAAHDAPSHADSVVTDTVALTGLVPGERYEVAGTLRTVEASDDGSLVAGEELARASVGVVADAEHMEVQLRFALDASELAGRTVNAAETLLANGEVVAAHDDVTDEGQSVRLPGIATQARNAATDGPTSPDEGEQVLIDTVSLSNLLVGEEYVLRSSAHAREELEDGTTTDGGALEGATVETSFTATERDMTLEVEIPYDAGELSGRAAVAFEELYRDDVLLATHADVDDPGQTLTVPDVRTTAAAEDGSQELTAAADQTITDRVEMEGLVPGVTYKLTASLHARGTGEDGSSVDLGPVASASGEPVEASTTFVAEGSEAVVEMELPVEADGLGSAASVVVFEELRSGDVTLARHADIADKGQTLDVVTPPEEPPAVPGEPGLPSAGEMASAAGALGLAGAALVAGGAAWRRRRGRQKLERRRLRR